MKIYTRAGDEGETGLLYGSKVSKNSPLPEAYGTVDEAQAILGLVRTECEKGHHYHFHHTLNQIHIDLSQNYRCLDSMCRPMLLSLYLNLLLGILDSCAKYSLHTRIRMD